MTLEEQRKFILTGAMYNDLTDELVKARKKAVILTNEYNLSYGKSSRERANGACYAKPVKIGNIFRHM